MNGARREKKANMYYDEYVKRRNEEIARRELEFKAAEDARRKENERKQQIAQRARSSNGRPSTNRRRKDDEEVEERRSRYQIESHPYEPNGFQTMNSELGEDPITAIRTMKNRLRKMAVSSTLDDRQVKTQLCQQACEELSKAEVQLEQLQRKRTNMLLQGDTHDADKIAKQMADIRNRAMHSSYVDLVMDRSQSAAFGVKSKWIPPDEATSEEEDKPIVPNKPKKKDDDMISVKSLNTRRKDREKAKAQENPKSSSGKRPESAAFKRPIKKNARLFEFNTDSQKNGVGKKGPYGLAEHEPMECQFCGENNTDFSRENLLKAHWAENCPCLTKCDFCDIVVETAVLNEHHLVRCKFVGKSLQPCSLCGLACYRGEPNHPRCRRGSPPDDAAWCPLCSIAVSPLDSKDAWKKHLTEDCYNNPRKHKTGVPGVKGKVPGFNDDDFLGSIDKITNQITAMPEPIPPPPIDPNQPLDPNNLPPGTIIQQTSGLSPEDIRKAFAQIKEDRKKQLAEMRKKEAEQEAQEEKKAAQDAKRLEAERKKFEKEKAAAAKKKS